MNSICLESSFTIRSVCLPFPFKDKLTDLKLVIEDTIDNVATLQDCNVDQVQPLQLLGQNTDKPTGRRYTQTSVCCHFNLTRVVSLRNPGSQDGARPGHRTGAEEHVC